MTKKTLNFPSHLPIPSFHYLLSNLCYSSLSGYFASYRAYFPEINQDGKKHNINPSDFRELQELRREELQRQEKTSSSIGPADTKEVRPHRFEIQINYYWKLLSVGRTEMAVGQIDQNQSSYRLSELRTVELHSACPLLSLCDSVEPGLEDKQTEHVTGFLLPRNVDNTTPDFQRHNNPTKYNQFFLTLGISPLSSHLTPCTLDPCHPQMFTNAAERMDKLL